MEESVSMWVFPPRWESFGFFPSFTSSSYRNISAVLRILAPTPGCSRRPSRYLPNYMCLGQDDSDANYALSGNSTALRMDFFFLSEGISEGDQLVSIHSSHWTVRNSYLNIAKPYTGFSYTFHSSGFQSISSTLLLHSLSDTPYTNSPIHFLDCAHL